MLWRSVSSRLGSEYDTRAIASLQDFLFSQEQHTGNLAVLFDHRSASLYTATSCTTGIILAFTCASITDINAGFTDCSNKLGTTIFERRCTNPAEVSTIITKLSIFRLVIAVMASASFASEGTSRDIIPKFLVLMVNHGSFRKGFILL